MMNFNGNIPPPNFSVPPPPININSVNNGMCPRPNRNQFPPFCGQMYNTNPSFPPINPMVAQRLQGQMNFSPNSNFHQKPQLNWGFSSQNGNGRGRFPQSVQSQPSQNHNRQQTNPANRGYDNIFGGAVNNPNTNIHSFPHTHGNPRKQHENKPQNQSTFGHGGRGFQSGRGGSGRGSRGHGNLKPFNKNNNQRNSGGPPKKKKENKKDLPENNLFFCDICDRGFKTEEKYKEHVDGHQKCTFKDCPFVAAPKLVQLHMSMQHKSGMAKRIWSVESEEDIKKWRDERKRNYPSAENIQKKKELKAERIKRGEVLETKEFSKIRKGRNKERGRGRGRGRGRFNRGRFEEEERQESSADDDGAPVEMKIVRSSSQEKEEKADNSPGKSNQGPDKTVNTHETIVLIEDEATVQIDQGENQNAEANVSSLTLLSGYGISSDGEDSSDDDNSNEEMTTNTAHTTKQALPITDEAIQISSTEGEDSPPNSPTKHDKDPFNLNNNNSDSLHPDSLETCHPLVNSVPAIELINLLAQNQADEDAQSFLEAGCEKSFSILPVDGGETFSENVRISSGTERLEDDENRSDSTCGAVSRPDSRRGRKREYDQQRDAAHVKKRRPNHRPDAKSYTLLEKLLAPEIRQERNKILQCVYYIVNKKFFDDNAASSKS